MQFANILLLGATLSAPVAHAIIAFTQTPGSVQAGVPTLIKWSGGDDSETTTITLKNGKSNDLQYVDTIAKNLRTSNFTWTPSSSLSNGDYALQIEQGNDTPNYSGMFSLSGGSKKAASVASTSSPATTASSSSSSSSSKSASTTVTKTTPLAALPIGTSNSTTAAPKNATAPNTVLLGTGVGTGASSAGTGTALHRNTTMSKPTLSSTKSSSTAKSTSASSTGSETSSSTSGGASAAATGAATAMRIGSPVAFVVSVMAAVVYLG